jgi:predicted MFS family arabinose efflux permease
VGFVSAASLGKLVPHLDWLVRTYDVPLGAAGFALSCVMLPGALAGWSFGTASDRFGPKRVAIAGLLVAAAASVLSGFAGNFPVLVGLRIVEGVGYTLLVVAATVIAAGIVPGRTALALSVWSSFAPIGFALGQWAAAYAPDPPLPVVGAAHAVVLILAAIALHFSVDVSITSREKTASSGEALRHAPALWTAAAFGGVCAVLLASIALAPVVLANHSQLPVAHVASLTALAALPAIVGRIAPGWLLERGFAAFTVFVTASALGALSLAAALVAPLPLAAALVLFGAFQILAGALPGLLSAMLTHVAPAPAQLGTVSGMCSQAVNIGNLIGPPLALAVYAAAGTGAAVLMLIVLLGASALAIARLGVFRRDLRGKSGQAA